MRLRLAALLVALVLLCGCVSYNPPPETQKNESITPPNVTVLCSDLKDRDEGDRCYYNDAISKNNITACDSIFSNPLRDSCNQIFAIKLKDPTLCTKLFSSEVRDDCYHTLAPTAGLMTCKKIENESTRRQCRLELGDETVLCENITDEYDNKLCLAKAEKNYSLCAEIANSSLVDSCYVDFAKSKGSYSLCALPSNKGMGDDCFRYFAALNSNFSICNMISSNYTKYLCLTKLTGDYKLCNELTDYLQRDSCIEVFADEHINQSVCANISTHLYQDRCYTAIAVRTKNPDICSYMVCYECIDDRNLCYHQVANVSANASICSRISESFRKDTCSRDIAKFTSRPALCSAIENTYNRNTCYFSIIYNQKYTLAACDEIDYQNWKDECYKKFAVDNKNSTVCDSISDKLVKADCEHGSV